MGLSLQGEGAFDSNTGSGDLLPLLKLALLLLSVPHQVMGAGQCPAPGGLRILGSEGFAGKHSPGVI